MKKLTLGEIAEAIGGKISAEYKNIEIFDISTDTRKVKEGDLFIPIVGEKFDAHDFIGEAFSKGAVSSLSMRENTADGRIIQVADTKEALAALAEYYVSLFDIPIAAVTGSTGKTTTKELIYSVLSQKYKTIKTEGNFNNDIGLPLTAFRIDEDTETVIFEMGMNHFGEIHKLSKIAKPDICVISNVGVSHIENLGSRDGILKAKCEIFDFMKKGGTKIVNGDDDKLVSVENAVRFAIDNEDVQYRGEIISESLTGISAKLITPKGDITVDIPISGRHMVLNALAAAAVGQKLGVSNDSIKAGIEGFKPAKMRADIVTGKRYTVINDVYNANPESVKAGINILKNANTRKVAVLGDMLELGSFAPELHAATGKYAAEAGIDVIVSIGEYSENMAKGAKDAAKENQKVYSFPTKEEFIKEYQNILKENDTVLVKASRGMHFEKIVESITEE